MAAITFSGLATGFDSNAVIDSLVALDRQPISVLDRRKADAQKRVTILSDLVTKLQALSAKAQGLDTATEVRPLLARSSDEARLRATIAGAPAAGSYRFSVQALASAQTSRSNGFSSENVGADGSLGIAVGSDVAVTVGYSATDTLADLASRINASGARVNASVLFDGTQHRLLVSGREPGANNAVGFSDPGGVLGLADPGALVSSASDAALTVSGVAIFRHENRLTDVLSGVTLDLASVTPTGGADTVVTIGADPAAARTKLKELVSAYNDVARVLSAQLTYSGVRRGTDTLFGDSSLKGLQARLAGILTTSYPSGTGTLAAGQLGVAIGKDGTLVLDESKLDAALEADPLALSRLLAGEGAPALAAGLQSLISEHTTSGVGARSIKRAGERTLIRTIYKQRDEN
jgi:flagellar hook-associated protein 2